MTRASLVGLALCLAPLAGCGSSAPSSFYALSPKGGASQPGTLHVIKLRRPGIAGYLDRPEIVRKVADFRVEGVDTDRWSAPLDEMLGRVLAQDLEQRLNGSSVYTEDGPITADADATVEVDIRSFNVGENGEADLVAEVAVERGATHVATGSRAVHLHEALNGATTPAFVRAMSDLLGQLADQIAALLRSG